jgi:hypothetical protein
MSIGSIAKVTARGRGYIAYSMATGAIVQVTHELRAEWIGQVRTSLPWFPPRTSVFGRPGPRTF